MKKRIVVLLALLLASALLASCAGTTEAVPVAEEAGPEVVETAALTVGEISYTMSELEAMHTIDVEFTGKDGEVSVFTGVLVMDLLIEAGLAGETVVFTASDGYEAELLQSELEDCADCVVAFDGDELRMVLPGFPSSVQVKGVVEIGVK